MIGFVNSLQATGPTKEVTVITRNIPKTAIERAARKVGVVINELRPIGPTGFRFTLRPGAPTLPGKLKRETVRFIRRGHMCSYRTGAPRTVWAVCWHGHRDFFRALLKLAPGGKVQTTFLRNNPKGDKWYTAENFDRLYHDTDRNIGSQMSPMYASEACWCNDR